MVMSEVGGAAVGGAEGAWSGEVGPGGDAGEQRGGDGDTGTAPRWTRHGPCGDSTAG